MQEFQGILFRKIILDSFPQKAPAPRLVQTLLSPFLHRNSSTKCHAPLFSNVCCLLALRGWRLIWRAAALSSSLAKRVPTHRQLRIYAFGRFVDVFWKDKRFSVGWSTYGIRVASISHGSSNPPVWTGGVFDRSLIPLWYRRVPVVWRSANWKIFCLSFFLYSYPGNVSLSLCCYPRICRSRMETNSQPSGVEITSESML